jgi:hypothetical protein
LTSCAGREGKQASVINQPAKKEVINMKLLTKKLCRQLPPLYTNENVSDPQVICKFFTPDSSWTWYAFEFDGQDTFYGLVEGLETEFGYFSLKELQSVRGKLGLPVERDLYFSPCKLSNITTRR